MGASDLVRTIALACGIASTAVSAEAWHESPAERLQAQFERHFLQVFPDPDARTEPLIVVAEAEEARRRTVRASRPDAIPGVVSLAASELQGMILPGIPEREGQHDRAGDYAGLSLSHE